MTKKRNDEEKPGAERFVTSAAGIIVHKKGGTGTTKSVKQDKGSTKRSKGGR